MNVLIVKFQLPNLSCTPRERLSKIISSAVMLRPARTVLPLAMIYSLLAVAGPALSAAPAAGAPQPAKVLHFWLIRRDRGLHAAIRVFEARHPGVRVRESLWTGTERLITAIAGGAPPDLLVADRFTIGGWAQRRAFMALNHLIKRSEQGGNSGSVPAIIGKNFYPACWREAVYHGRVYGIPLNTDDRMLYYNCDLLRRAGLVHKAGHAAPPRTWAQLAHDETLLTRRDAYGNLRRLGFSPTYGNSLYTYAFLDGGRFMNRAGTRITMDSPPVLRALRFIDHLAGLIGGVNQADAFLTSSTAPELDPFLTGKVAMKIDDDRFLQTIARYKPYLRFGVAPAPTPTGHHPATWSGGFAYCIPAGSPHPRTAFALIRFLVRACDKINVTISRVFGRYFQGWCNSILGGFRGGANECFFSVDCGSELSWHRSCYPGGR